MRTARYVIALVVLLAASGCVSATGTEDPRSAITPDSTATDSPPGSRTEGQRLAITPDCVAPGETVTLTVRATPGSPVLYAAKYADGKSGAPEPMGAGYGGNDGGFANAEGVYESSWTVAARAPSGPVTVKVVLPDREHAEDERTHTHDGSEHRHSHGEEHGHTHDETTAAPSGDDRPETPELEGAFQVSESEGC